MEYKYLPFFLKEIDKKNRTATGIFAVNGNVDSGGDMSVNGAFEKGLKDGSRDRVRFLWGHNSMNPPIASIKDIHEVGRDGLPTKVLDWAPDATGGMEVTRKYYEGVELSDWVFKAIDEGDVTEMSYAYDINEYSIKKLEDGKEIRILNDLTLYDISDVNWGMNPATAGVKGLPVTGMTFVQHSAMVESTIEEFLARVNDRKNFREQEGRTLSETTRGRLQKMASEIETILAKTAPMVDVSEVLNEIAKFEKSKLN
jgi:HK97 family phage prohead protease